MFAVASHGESNHAPPIFWRGVIAFLDDVKLRISVR
jgi:hypothetical protein